MNSKYKKLMSIYDRIPKVSCKGLCQDSCTIAPATKIEIKRAKEFNVSFNLFSHSKVLSALKNVLLSDIPVCKALKNGRCSVYHVRPTICRLYGAAEGLECEFGCKPDRYLSRSEAQAILNEVESL